jgi:flagellar P-ring protein precursor FlgI
MRIRWIAGIILCTWLLSGPGWGAVRIKDIAKVQGTSRIPLVGYGLVVGLDGSGDGRGARFTAQSVANMMERMGISVSPDRIKVDNVAAVMLTARLSPFVKKGSAIDVTVSSVGDASSLQGGTLLLTPLASADGSVYATAQGAVSIGGFNFEAKDSDRFTKNHALVGRVPNGALVERELEVETETGRELRIVLAHADYTTAARLADAVDEAFDDEIATPLDAGTVAISVSAEDRTPGGMVRLIEQIEAVEVEPDAVARVVVNEKTGTIVAGSHVTLSAVAVSHGNLSIEIRGTPVISQPRPFSMGRTVVTTETEMGVREQQARLMVLEESTSVGDVAKALNALGVSPRDMIAIFQALKQAGALRAELIVL